MSVAAPPRPPDRVVAPGKVTEKLTPNECALFALLTDESGLDSAEFLWHDPKTPDGCFRAWPFQWPWWRCDDQLQADQCGRSIGKALDVDTPVPTPDGWTTMGALRVGDMVFDDAGQPTTVLEAFDVQVDRPCAEVRFDDGNAIVADLDHLWGTWTGTPSDRQFHVRTTAEIGRTLRRKGQNDHRVDVARPIAGTRAGLPFSPYALGYWLGDGASAHSGLTIGDQDIDEARAIIESEGFVLRKRRDLYGYGVHFPSQWVDLPVGPSPPTTTQRVSDEQVREIRERARLGEPLLELAAAFDTSAASITQWVVGQYRRSAGGPVREPEIPVGRVLTAMGLIGNKHIPRNYLRASVADRVALLQGLMDSDGHCRADGRCEITLTNERLIQDVYELLVSLGQKPFFERKRATLRGVDVGAAYRIGFHPLDITPFRFNRKACRVKPPRRQDRVRQRRVVAVKPVASRPVRCIRVAAKSHMFLVGRGFIPTHNSESIKARVCAFPLCFAGEEMVITAPELIHLEPIISKVEDQIFRSRFLREMIAKGRRSVTHRPFEMVFANGARLVGRIPQRDGRGMKGCVAEGTLILTAEGYRPVETLEPGDLVLTHKNRWRPVVKVKTDVHDCFEVSGQSSFPVTVSCDHLFYGAENLATAKQPRNFDYGLTYHNVNYLLETKVYWATPTVFEPLPVPQLEYNGTARHLDQESLAFWWLVGRYLADGFLSENRHNGKERRVQWAVTEARSAEITDRLDELGLPWHRRVREHSSADIIATASAPMQRWLREHFGEHADGKRLAGFVLGMPETQRSAVLAGYLAGDGHKCKDRKRIQLETASKALALGIQMLGQSLGYTANCTIAQPKVTHIRGVALKKPPLPSYRVQLTTVGTPVRMGEHLVAKVKRVENVGPVRVYNPMVEDDHTYVSNGVVSHNLHPLRLELDEGQDFPKAGYAEIFETLKMGEPRSQWRIHGVPRGTRDAFHKITTSNKDFTVHRITAMSRPSWSKEERAKKIRQYGSSDDPDYRRNIWGEHGDVTNALFVLSKLYACVDLDEVSEYNLIEFHKKLIRDSDLTYAARQENREEADILIDLLDLPQRHLDRYNRFWIGMDVGYTSDPSEILIFAEYHPDEEERKVDKVMSRATPAKGLTRVRCIGRITLRRISAPLQEIAIAHLYDFYQPEAFAMDKTGNGLPLFQAVQERLRQAAGDDRAAARKYAATFRGYNFSSKVVVDVDETVKIEEEEGKLPQKADTLLERDDPEAVAEQAGIKQTVLEYSTDALRKLVDNGRLMLPFEADDDDDDGPGGGGTIIEEFQGMTFSYSKSPIDSYGKRRRVFQEGRFHAFDAARMAAMALFQTPIETFLAKKEEQKPVYDYFVPL